MKYNQSVIDIVFFVKNSKDWREMRTIKAISQQSGKKCLSGTRSVMRVLCLEVN